MTRTLRDVTDSRDWRLFMSLPNDSPIPIRAVASAIAAECARYARNHQENGFQDLSDPEADQLQQFAAEEYAKARAWADVARGADPRTISLDYDPRDR